MRTLNSHFLLIDLHASGHATNQVPISTFSYIRKSNFITTVSSSFCRTRRTHKGIASSKPSAPSSSKPSDRFFSGNGSVFNPPSSPSTSRSAVDAELERFLELLPSIMRKELYKHEDLGQLIEVVMDLGRQPLARFPSGDWVISEKPVAHEDLQHAISKVISKSPL